jgi:hypothetical protein
MRKFTAIMSIVVGLGAVTSAHASDLKDLFDSFSSGQAGAYRASNGTHLYGGNITARIHQPRSRDVVGFTPPSLKSGCGGIDFYAGSFSMISGDEVVQMARGIAQGAAPYFFKLAVSSICSNCSAAMEDLENRLAELNQFARTSCESFYDRLDESAGQSWSKSMENMVSVQVPSYKNEEGLGNWMDMVFKEPGGNNTNPQIIKLLATNAPYSSINEALGAASFGSSPFYKDRTTYLELIMTMTGAATLKIDDPKPQQTYASDLSPVALMYGNDKDANNKPVAKYTKLTCERDAAGTLTNNCATVIQTETTFPPLYEYYFDLMYGAEGIFRKLQSKQSFTGVLGTRQLEFMRLADYPYVGIAVRAKHPTDLEAASKYIANKAAYELTSQLYSNAINLLIRSKDVPINEKQGANNKAKLEEYIARLQSELEAAEKAYQLKMSDLNAESITNLSFLRTINGLSK